MALQHKIEELAAGEEIKAREFSYSAFGENQNAVEWQIWAAMLTHLVLRYIKWKNKVVSSYTRFAAIIKNTIWLKRSLEAVINFYCIAPGEKCENIGFWRMA